MKRKLFLLLCALLTMIGVQAQTDVTSTYLTNPGFEDCVAETADKTTGSNIDYASSGWTSTSNGAQSCGAVVAYGGVNVNGKAAPSADNAGNSGNALGISVGWTQTVTYKSASVTLPAGYYILSANVYNSNNEGSIFTSKLGFITGSASYLSTSPSYPFGTWVKDEVAFYLSEDTEGYFQIGGTAQNNTSTTNAKAFFDNLRLIRSDKQMDYTSSVSKTAWKKGDGNDSGTTTGNGVALRENYGDAAVGTKLYQDVSGLKNGIYSVVLYATSHNARGEGGAALNGTRDDVAYVFATSSEGTKKTYFTASGVTPGFLYNEPLQCTINDIEVKDGEITLGLGLDEANVTGWHTIQIKSLTRTADLDLSGYVAAYEAALTAAKEKAATTEKISATVLAALNATITLYDDGQVDKESQDALETATDALSDATAAANASIASYAIIEAGVVPDNSLDGWVCENTNTFHINTWSTEGNSDGSNMTTPFIENWVAKGSYLGAGKIYYQLSGLEPGEVYYASALVRSYNEASTDAPNGPTFFVNDNTRGMTTEGTTFTYNNMSGIYATLGIQAEVGSDGILKLGVEIASDRNYNWVAFKSVKIQELSTAYNEAVANAEALEGQIPTAAYAAVSSALSEYSEVTVSNINSINDVVTTYSALVSPYAAYVSLDAKADILVAVANDDSDANSTLATAISTAATNIETCTTADAINTVTSTLKTAMQTYVFAANPVGDGAQFDCTFMLTNPDLTGLPTWTGAAGWYTEQDGGNSQVMTNDGAAGPHGNAFYEYWSEAAAANNKFALYQKVTLPEGTYSMECDAFSSQATGGDNCAVYFYANDTQGDLVNNYPMATKTISFVNGSEQEVKIGLKALAGNTYRWMGIGYVKLYKVPAQTYTVDEDQAWDNSQSGAGDVTLNRTIKVGVNTLVLPFSMTQAEVESTFGTGSKVYAVSSYNTETENISFAVRDGISANQPCLLKATVAGTTYDLTDRTIVAGTPTSSGTNVTLTGSYAASISVPQGANNYIVSGDMLYQVNSSVTMKNTRAYITISGGDSSARLSLSFDDDSTTAINTIESAETTDAAPKDGKFLENGKIVIVKNGVKYSANGQILK